MSPIFLWVSKFHVNLGVVLKNFKITAGRWFFFFLGLKVHFWDPKYPSIMFIPLRYIDNLSLLRQDFFGPKLAYKVYQQNPRRWISFLIYVIKALPKKSKTLDFLPCLRIVQVRFLLNGYLGICQFVICPFSVMLKNTTICNKPILQNSEICPIVICPGHIRIS